MKLLDLFCGAGGCSVGYYRAGFLDITGVDISPQPHYPYRFVQADALEYVRLHGHEYDVIHASPPCQAYSVTHGLSSGKHEMLVEKTREVLIATGKPYVIENVPGAPLRNPLLLCGTMFGLDVIRHRLFECTPPIYFPPAMCCHDGKSAQGTHLRKKGVTRTPSRKDGFRFVTVVGNGFLVDEGRAAMGIDWMTQQELSQAIPPAYTEFIGKCLMDTIKMC